MRTHRRSSSVLPLLVSLGLAGCLAPPLESAKPNGVEFPVTSFPLSVRDKVDILFLVDNSASMDAMQEELKRRFPQFFKPFQDRAAAGVAVDLHIGVVTSDYGAGRAGATGCTPSGIGGGGDMGRLIAIGRKAAPGCQRPRGRNFIEYRFGDSVESNLPPGQDLVETFTCMASVGSSGCGFEHQLESVYAALHNDIPDNRGFLREDALLVVVFVTNEDDASAPPDTDLFDKDKVGQYGYLSSYPRQTRFGVMCGDPLAFPPYGDSGGPLTGCVPAPNPDGNGPGKLYDVQRYRDFFRLPRLAGGVKDNPLDVVLIGIDAPAEPFQVVLADPGTPAGQPPRRCDRLAESGNPPCVPVLEHSCENPRNPAFFGDPAVRLNAVIGSVQQSSITSICADDFSPALDQAARLVVSSLGSACFRHAFPRDATGRPTVDCQVQQVIPSGDGSEQRLPIPACDQGTSPPCYRFVDEPLCEGISPDRLTFTLDLGESDGRPVKAPAHSYAVVECRTRPAR